MVRRIAFMMTSLAVSIGIVHVTNVVKRLAREGRPLLPLTSDVIASPAYEVDPSAAGILPVPILLRASPSQSIFGPGPLSPNPAPPPVEVHPRDLSATPLPSAPLIAGSATDSVPITREKSDDK